MGIYYKECLVEQLFHFGIIDNKIWKQMKSGKRVSLYLYRDNNNVKDYEGFPKQIKVNFKGVTIGVLSEDDSKPMLLFFEKEWNKIFYANFCCLDKEQESPKIKIVIYILSEDEIKCLKCCYKVLNQSCHHKK